jgi:uncharacterized repeat protein (TIGR03803 family)
MPRIREFSSKCIAGFGLAMAALLPLSNAHAGNFRVMHTFTGESDGWGPWAGLISDSKGNLYGTTLVGGRAGCGPYEEGCGTVFMLMPRGKETVLYAFAGGTDGYAPSAALLADKAGNFYGTTFEGGSNACGGDGCGTVFKLTPHGGETVLYAFTGGVDGSLPQAGLIADKAGNLYGTTYEGGNNNFACGVVFKVAAHGAETVLHTFTGDDGCFPNGGLLADKHGNLYGTTVGGGSDLAGTVFKLAPNGTETVLHSFSNSDGSLPEGNLMLDASGNLYGTASEGGKGSCHNGYGCGTVFMVAPNGAETVLHYFTDGSGGGNPSDGVIADNSGDLYATTGYGGSHGDGTVFKLTPDGIETVLHAFNGGDGSNPSGGLILINHNLYGTTPYGGADEAGTVFKLRD